MWEIEERKFGGDCRRMMFNVIVKSTVLYGIEIYSGKSKTKLTKTTGKMR